MSAQQLAAVEKDVVDTFTSWGPDTSLEQMRQGWDDLFAKVPCTVGAKIERIEIGGRPTLHIAASNAAPDRAVLYLHGGGYVLGSPKSHRDLGEYLSRSAQAQVFVLDYRLAPEHPFPAPVEDAIAAYRWLLDKGGFKPERIAISGDSAGGGLTLATMLAIKQHKLPMPACGTPMSPWVDMEGIGDSMTTKDSVDPMVHKPLLENLVKMYLPNGNVRDPLAAPLYGDLKGLPPLLIQVGTRETLLDDSRRIVDKLKKAGVDVKLEEEEGQIHVFQIFASRLDEGVAAIERIGAFIRKHTA